jgi:hypothetical protein
VRGIGDLDTDRTEADDAESAAGQFMADEALLALLDRRLDRVPYPRPRTNTTRQIARRRNIDAARVPDRVGAPGSNTGTPRFDMAATGMLLVGAAYRLTLAGISIECMSADRTRRVDDRSPRRPALPRQSSSPRTEMLFSVSILKLMVSPCPAQPLRAAKARMNSISASTPSRGIAL